MSFTTRTNTPGRDDLSRLVPPRQVKIRVLKPFQWRPKLTLRHGQLPAGPARVAVIGEVVEVDFDIATMLVHIGKAERVTD